MSFGHRSRRSIRMFSGERREGSMRRLGSFQSDLCFHCSSPVFYAADGVRFTEDERERLASVEHLVPRSLGGEGRLENLVVAHRRCNNARRSVLPSPEERGRLAALNAARAGLIAEIRQDIAEFGVETPGVLNLSSALDRLLGDDPGRRERTRRLFASRLARMSGDLAALAPVARADVRARASALLRLDALAYVSRHLARLAPGHFVPLMRAFLAVENAVAKERGGAGGGLPERDAMLERLMEATGMDAWGTDDSRGMTAAEAMGWAEERAAESGGRLGAGEVRSYAADGSLLLVTPCVWRIATGDVEEVADLDDLGARGEEDVHGADVLVAEGRTPRPVRFCTDPAEDAPCMRAVGEEEMTEAERAALASLEASRGFAP